MSKPRLGDDAAGERRARILTVIRRVPRGRVATYGQIAALAGLPGRARLVGRVLRDGTAGDAVPWQRVLNARGEVSPRGGPGWEEGLQRALLREEGVAVDARGRIDLDRWGWEPRDPRSPAARARRRPLSPAAEVRVIAKRLAALGTAARARGAKAYLKSDLTFLGVATDPLRAAARGYLRAHPELRGAPLRALGRALWREPVHELRAFALELLLARPSELKPADLPLLESWLRRSRSWAYVDAIAIHLVGPLVEGHRDVARHLDRWARDRDFWLRRSALLALLLPLRRGGGDWPRFVRYADAMLDESELFIRKAIGWVLREVGKREPARVVEFLGPRRARASGLTVREAVKYLPAAERARLRAR